MPARGIQLLLLIASVAGAALTLREASTQGELLREYRRLSAEWGDLELQDPMKVHVVALETDEPLHFAWRMYLPPSCSGKWEWISDTTRDQNRWTSPGSNSIPFDSICRVRFRKNAKNGWQVFISSGNGATLNAVNGRLASLLDKGPEAMKIMRAGLGQTQVVEQDRIVDILKIDGAPDATNEPASVVYRFGLDEAFASSRTASTAGE